MNSPLQDYIRTSTYQKAMLQNEVDFKDKVQSVVFCSVHVLTSTGPFYTCSGKALGLNHVSCFVKEMSALSLKKNQLRVFTSSRT